MASRNKRNKRIGGECNDSSMRPTRKKNQPKDALSDFVKPVPYKHKKEATS